MADAAKNRDVKRVSWHARPTVFALKVDVNMRAAAWQNVMESRFVMTDLVFSIAAAMSNVHLARAAFLFPTSAFPEIEMRVPVPRV